MTTGNSRGRIEMDVRSIASRWNLVEPLIKGISE